MQKNWQITYSNPHYHGVRVPSWDLGVSQNWSRTLYCTLGKHSIAIFDNELTGKHRSFRSLQQEVLHGRLGLILLLQLLQQTGGCTSVHDGTQASKRQWKSVGSITSTRSHLRDRLSYFWQSADSLLTLPTENIGPNRKINQWVPSLDRLRKASFFCPFSSWVASVRVPRASALFRKSMMSFSVVFQNTNPSLGEPAETNICAGKSRRILAALRRLWGSDDGRRTTRSIR